MNVFQAIHTRHSYRGRFKPTPVPAGSELVCFLPVGIAEGEPVIPKKKAFEERAWFTSFGAKS